MKGAVEKYAPVRAVPRSRSARTKSARLRAVANETHHAGDQGGGCARHRSTNRKAERQIERTGDQAFEFHDLQRIGKRNLARQVVIETPEIQAPTIMSGPRMLSSVRVPDHDRTAAPAMRHPIPVPMRRSKFS
jgi:hypothetical protein